jgi:tetratricopeptide (TPR) repeat protein
MTLLAGLGRRVFRPAFLIFIALILVVVYYFRADWFPRTSQDKVEIAETSAKTPETIAASLEQSRTSVGPRTTAADPQSAPDGSVRRQSESATEPSAPNESTATYLSERPSQEPARDVAGAEQASDQALQTGNPTQPGSAARSGPADPEVLVKSARMAFWNGNYPAAEKYYLELSKAKPDDPDAYGELGNVYYAAGQWDQAGRAYTEAANILVTEGRLDQAAQLLRIVEGLNPAGASQLQQRINDAKSKSN